MANSAILLIHCPDQPGLVAQVTEFVHKNSGNILDLDQHVDQELNHFFMRIEWDLTNFIIPKEKINDYFSEKRVLSRAIYLQLRHRILPFGNRTVIFS